MSANLLLSILLYDAEAHDLEAQIIREKTSKDAKHRTSSNEISKIKNFYNDEKTQIRNKIQSLDSGSSSAEYRSLTAELEEIKDEEDFKVASVEETATDYENSIQLRIDQDETRLEALKTDAETLKETNQENVKDSFSYFQN